MDRENDYDRWLHDVGSQEEYRDWLAAVEAKQTAPDITPERANNAVKYSAEVAQ